MSHTPMPWEYVQDGDEPYWSIGMAGQNPIAGNAMVYTREDDARLIAAAPELLEALKNVRRFFSLPGNAIHQDAIRQAEAAIAKAEGSGE